jgi:hypothetical protein
MVQWFKSQPDPTIPTQKQNLMQRYDKMKLRTVTHLESPKLTEPEAQTVANGGSVEWLGIANEDTLENHEAMLLDDNDELIADDSDGEFEIIDWA